MGAELARKYDLKVPRYTSYPTAPHFHAQVTGEAYRTWLGELVPGTELSLYFHIPFCDTMCWFCGCYTRIVQRYKPVTEYLDVLLQEVNLVAEALPTRFAARHLHWGGGSPTLLKGPDWLRMVGRIRARFDFAPGAEVAVEMDPRDTTEDYVRALADAGVNRASIGVQDFHPQTQAAINRIQPFAVTERVIGWLRRHGIDGINMDLMYGLPHQTVERVLEMVDLAVMLAPQRMALFGYAHVPWMKTHQRLIDEAALPGAEARWLQAEAAAARLVEHGYLRVGLDHFALSGDNLARAAAEGRARRNFQGYTTDEAPVLVGFGASAIGSLPRGYVQNTSPLRDYRGAVAEGRLPVHRGVALSDDDRLRRHVIERLMCDLAVDVGAACLASGAPEGTLDESIVRLAPLAGDGLVGVDGRCVKVNEEGRPFVRLVAAAFDAYLETGQARHSRAI